MKKLFYTAILMIPIIGFSQDFGLKGGLNIGKEKFVDSGFSLTSDGSLSFLAGFYANFSMSDQVSISPELIYSIDGGKFSFPGFSGKDRLSYLSIPVLLKFHATDRFNLHGGPQLGFLLDAESEVNGSTTDTTDGVKSTNFSFAFGGEVSFESLSLGLRYVLGLSNVSNDTDSSGEIKLNTLQIYIGIPLN